MSHPSDHPAPARVLLVDDSLLNQKLLSAFLGQREYSVTLANNGEQAVEMITSEEFDVVLMDVQMPVMDGLTATRLIRQMEADVRHTPIVGVTAGVDRQSCLDAGMDHYLSKPVLPDSLFNMLDQVIVAPQG